MPVGGKEHETSRVSRRAVESNGSRQSLTVVVMLVQDADFRNLHLKKRTKNL